MQANVRLPSIFSVWFIDPHIVEHTIANPPTPSGRAPNAAAHRNVTPASPSDASSGTSLSGTTSISQRTGAHSSSSFDPTRRAVRGTDAKHDVRHPDEPEERKYQVPSSQRKGSVNPRTGNVEVYTKKV